MRNICLFWGASPVEQCQKTPVLKLVSLQSPQSGTPFACCMLHSAPLFSKKDLV